MSFDPNIYSLAALDAEIIDQASVICHLFFSSRLPMKRIATILDISTVRVEVALMMAFERLQSNHPMIADDIYCFAAPMDCSDYENSNTLAF
jgi:hypothetical protein